MMEFIFWYQNENLTNNPRYICIWRERESKLNIGIQTKSVRNYLELISSRSSRESYQWRGESESEDIIVQTGSDVYV